MSLKPTLTDELLKVNSTIKIMLSVVEDNQVQNEEDSTSKQAHVNE